MTQVKQKLFQGRFFLQNCNEFKMSSSKKCHNRIKMEFRLDFLSYSDLWRYCVNNCHTSQDFKDSNVSLWRFVCLFMGYGCITKCWMLTLGVWAPFCPCVLSTWRNCPFPRTFPSACQRLVGRDDSDVTRFWWDAIVTRSASQIRQQTTKRKPNIADQNHDIFVVDFEIQTFLGLCK